MVGGCANLRFSLSHCELKKKPELEKRNSGSRLGWKNLEISQGMDPGFSMTVISPLSVLPGDTQL
jgi:hypothetical protein